MAALIGLDDARIPELLVAAGLHGTIKLTNGELLLDKDLTIIGPGAGRLQTGQGLLADLIAIAQHG